MGELESKKKGEFLERIEKVSEECTTCKKYKNNQSKPVVGFSLSKGFNEVLVMDVGEYEGQKFLVIMDHFSWYAQGVWLKNKKPEEIVKGIMMKCISVYGVLKKILIDNGREFQNEKVRRLMDALDTEVLTAAGESPFSNGWCERTVGLIKDGLKKGVCVCVWACVLCFFVFF